MGLREQRINIWISLETIVRAVYDVRNDTKYKIQTGYIQYNNEEVPVWRPYDPDDSSLDAKWRDGLWKNIYRLNMHHKKNTQYVNYDTENISLQAESVNLPKVSVVLSHELLAQLKKSNA